jgi:hypothetical protein
MLAGRWAAIEDHRCRRPPFSHRFDISKSDQIAQGNQNVFGDNALL